MATNILKCAKCKNWLRPIKEQMLCPECDFAEIARIGKENYDKFLEKNGMVNNDK